MSVNSFNHEDEMTAAYDAAERALWHAIDTRALRLPNGYNGDLSHTTISGIARRIVDAVIHSSSQDIADMDIGVKVERVKDSHLPLG